MFIESVPTPNQQAPSGAARVCVGLQDYDAIDTVGQLRPREHAASLLKVALLLSQHQANWQHVPPRATPTEFANSIKHSRNVADADPD